MYPAPIILFTYNRPWHTKQTVEALQKNRLANQSDLIVFSDGSKNEQNSAQVQEVRDYIKSLDGFKKIFIVERENNLGLAANILDGVTKVVQDYGNVIVMEDDIVTSPAFLTFMNQALVTYQHNSRIWHVSGWNYPVSMDTDEDVFCWRVMNCWGWATWADRWAHYNKNPKRLKETWTPEQKHLFDLDGSGFFWNQVERNISGERDTWAIFWYSTIFQREGLCLNPSLSYVENIGNDGSGMHCRNTRRKNYDISLNNKTEIKWTSSFEESTSAVMIIKDYYKKQKKSLLSRIVNKIKR